MGFREWTNKHSKVTAFAVCVVVLGCVGFIAAQVLGSRRSVISESPKHYFTVDDGKTFFIASGSNIAPFDHDGAIAVRAYVFHSGSQNFVGYLERYTRDAREIELSGKAAPPEVQWYGRELKKPGDTTWISSRDHAIVSKITRVVDPGGSSVAPTPVEPDF